MAKTGLGLRYVPNPPPDVTRELTLTDAYEAIRYLFDELLRMQAVLNQGLEGNCDARTTPPDKPRDGMIRKADGTNWNPGGGRGYYGYDEVSGTWKLLG